MGLEVRHTPKSNLVCLGNHFTTAQLAQGRQSDTLNRALRYG